VYAVKNTSHGVRVELPACGSEAQSGAQPLFFKDANGILKK